MKLLEFIDLLLGNILILWFWRTSLFVSRSQLKSNGPRGGRGGGSTQTKPVASGAHKQYLIQGLFSAEPKVEDTNI